MNTEPDFITTAEAAAKLGLTVRRVQAMLNASKFAGAQKLGRDWLIPRASLAGVTVYGIAGRPRKDANTQTS